MGARTMVGRETWLNARGTIAYRKPLSLIHVLYEITLRTYLQSQRRSIVQKVVAKQQIANSNVSWAIAKSIPRVSIISSNIQPVDDGETKQKYVGGIVCD